MRRIWLIILLLLTAVSPTCLQEETPKQDPQCYEDEPCWNCHTMGNLVCGTD